jgi:hypothetical protein
VDLGRKGFIKHKDLRQNDRSVFWGMQEGKPDPAVSADSPEACCVPTSFRTGLDEIWFADNSKSTK